MALASYKTHFHRPLWPFYLVFILFTGFCGFHLLGEIYTTYTRYHQGIVAVGTVQAVRNESNTDAAWTTYAITFKSADGQTHTVTNHNATVDSPARYQVGQVVRVLYLPEDADAGRIDSDREKYGVITGLLVMFLTGLSTLAFIFLKTHRTAITSRAMGVAAKAH